MSAGSERRRVVLRALRRRARAPAHAAALNAELTLLRTTWPGYVTKLNEAVPGTKWEGASLEDIIRGSEGKVFNLAAQIWNHTFYWNSMSPRGGGEPTGAIKDAIEASFGSFDAFKERFTASAAGHFGSGWAWLVQREDGKLEVLDTHDAANPLRDGFKPILTCDVWEHAYYIDFRNDRGAYVKGSCVGMRNRLVPARSRLAAPRSLVEPG